MIAISDSDADILVRGIRASLGLIDKRMLDNKTYNIIRRMGIVSQKIGRKMKDIDRQNNNPLKKTIRDEDERL